MGISVACLLSINIKNLASVDKLFFEYSQKYSSREVATTQKEQCTYQ